MNPVDSSWETQAPIYLSRPLLLPRPYKTASPYPLPKDRTTPCTGYLISARKPISLEE